MKITSLIPYLYGFCGDILNIFLVEISISVAMVTTNIILFFLYFSAVNLKIKRNLPGKLKFDWNSTNHQSGTEELHERARASYLGNIQRNRECEQEHGTEELGREGISLPDPGHVIPLFLTDDL
jgi:hypothetical protein